MTLPVEVVFALFIFAAWSGYQLRSMTMLDIKELQAQIEKENREEEAARAKNLLKEKSKQIIAARRVLANLEREYNDLVVRIGEGSV